MRVLHTSDWHLGKTTWSHARTPDHEAVLAEIVDIAAAQQVDLIVNTGDLFDQQRPPVQALRLATDVLNRLAAIAPVVVISGNHDSAPLLHWLNGLMNRDDRIHIVADPDAVRVGTVLRFPVGNARLHLAALPFITANRIVNALDDPNDRRRSYADHIASLQQQLLHDLHQDFDPARDVSVLAAHQYVSGSIPATTENRNHTCDFYATDPERIPPVTYAAFGHIHKPQDLPGSRIVGAYAGSPIQLDFGEVDDDKSVVVAHLEPGADTQIVRVPLRAGRRLMKLQGTLDELRELAGSVTDEICRVTVNVDGPQLDLSRQVGDLFPHATIVHVGDNDPSRKLDLITLDAARGEEPDNVAMFGAYLAERGTKHAPADDVLKMFAMLLAHVGDEDLPPLPAEEALAADLDAFAVPTDEEVAALCDR